jgi:hypothetical protein
MGGHGAQEVPFWKAVEGQAATQVAFQKRLVPAQLTQLVVAGPLQVRQAALQATQAVLFQY